MRHKSKKITLGRELDQRRALLRGLAENLVLRGSIRTTRAKARALRRFIEPIVTKAKTDKLNNRRVVAQVLYTDEAIKKMFKEIAPRYMSRPGGYTRITKLAPRQLDAAEMVRIEFV